MSSLVYHRNLRKAIATLSVVAVFAVIVVAVGIGSYVAITQWGGQGTKTTSHNTISHSYSMIENGTNQVPTGVAPLSTTWTTITYTTSATNFSYTAIESNASYGQCTHSVSYPSFSGCAAPMNYTTLNQLIDNPNNSFENNGNGTIYLYVGQNACTIWYYFLPNQTNVIEYLGTTGTETCA